MFFFSLKRKKYIENIQDKKNRNNDRKTYRLMDSSSDGVLDHLLSYFFNDNSFTQFNG